MLKHAIKVSKAKRVSTGYLVKGDSGTTYSVADNLAVYEVKGEEKRYVCIVDLETNTNTGWGLNDALAKRLLLLRHDVKVMSEVHTIKIDEEEEL